LFVFIKDKMFKMFEISSRLQIISRYKSYLTNRFYKLNLSLKFIFNIVPESILKGY